MKYVLMAAMILLTASVGSAEMVKVKDSAAPVQYQTPWVMMRVVDTNDPNVTSETDPLIQDPNTGWSYANTSSYKVDSRWTGIIIQTMGYGDNDVNDANFVDDPNLGTFKWELLVSKKYGGLQKIAFGTWSIGNCRTTVNPETGRSLSGVWKFGSKPVITTQEWYSTILAKGFVNGPGSLYLSTLNIDSIVLRVNTKKLFNKLMVFVSGTQ